MPVYTVAQVCTSVSWQEKLSALLSRFIFLVNTSIVLKVWPIQVHYQDIIYTYIWSDRLMLNYFASIF